MVKLSRPGDNVQPVSYIDKIDDANVLKALERLRSRAINISATNRHLPKTNSTSNKTSTPPRIPIGQPSAAVLPSKSSSVSRPREGPSGPSHMTTPRARSRSSSVPSSKGKLPLIASTPPILKSSRESDEFIPKWKTNPRVDTEAIPRWQRETLAQERAAQELERQSAEARALAHFESVQKASTSKPVMVPVVTPGPKSNTVRSPDDEANSRSTNPGKPTSGLMKRLAFLVRRMPTPDECDDQTKETTKASLEESQTKEESRVGLLVESICTFGCYNMVDQVFNPTLDDVTHFTGADDAARSIIGDDDESEGGYNSTRATPFSLDHDRTFETGVGTLDSDELTQRGLFEFGPMISILERLQVFLDGGVSDLTQRQYMTSLLEGMEDRLYEYGGYRHRRRGKRSPDPQTVSEHIVEVNKLILRIVESFIDNQVMKATHGDDLSFGSTRASLDETTFTDDEEFSLIANQEGGSTWQVERIKHALGSMIKEEDCGVMPHRGAFDRDLRPAFVVESKSPPSITSTKKREKTTFNDAASLQSFGVSLGQAKFIAADGLTGGVKPASRPKRGTGSDDGRSHVYGTDDEKSFHSSRTGSSRRTALMSNLTSMFSRSPAGRRPELKRSQSEGSMNPTHDSGKTTCGEGISTGMPPLHPEVSCEKPVRRMPFGMKRSKRQSSGNKSPRTAADVTVATAVGGKESPLHLVDTSMESSDGGSVSPFDGVSV